MKNHVILTAERLVTLQNGETEIETDSATLIHTIDGNFEFQIPSSWDGYKFGQFKKLLKTEIEEFKAQFYPREVVSKKIIVLLSFPCSRREFIDTDETQLKKRYYTTTLLPIDIRLYNFGERGKLETFVTGEKLNSNTGKWEKNHDFTGYYYTPELIAL